MPKPKPQTRRVADPGTPRVLYNAPTAARMLGISPPTFWRHIREWPHRRIGSRVLLSDADIAAIVELSAAAPVGGAR